MLFAERTTRRLRRFAHRSVTVLEADVRRWINEWSVERCIAELTAEHGERWFTVPAGWPTTWPVRWSAVRPGPRSRHARVVGQLGAVERALDQLGEPPGVNVRAWLGVRPGDV